MARKIEYGEPEDPLKDFEEICAQDRYGIVPNVRSRYKKLEEINLHEDVPKDVRQIFETAKNISLYASYAYRLHQPAELIGYIALEHALRRKYEIVFPQRSEIGKTPTFKGLSDMAIEKGWIVDEAFSSRRHIAKHRVEMKALEYAIENREDDRALFIDDASEDEIDDEMRQMYVAAEFLEASRNVRNLLGHGSTALSPTSIGVLSDLSEAINYIFTKG